MYSNTQILQDLRRVFTTLERPFSRREYDEVGNVSKSTVERRFGTWTEALRKAKLLGKFEKARKKIKARR